MVQTGFTRKNVASLTLGEKLRKLRGDFRMSLHEASRATKIQEKYLEYLENGEYGRLPADVYVRGFLRSYARYLNVDEQIFIRLYERERHIQTNLGRNLAAPTQPREVKISSLVVTPRSLVVGLVVLLVAGAFFYLYREFQSFAADPFLVVETPAESAVLDSSETTVKGRTDRGAQVSINGQPVYVGNDGGFTDALILQPGLNTIRVSSVNRFGKEKAVTLSVEARYQQDIRTPDALPPPSGTQPFHIDIAAGHGSQTVSIRADGTVVYSGTLQPGETKRFEASDTLAVTASDGADTVVRFNDAPAEPLAATNGPVKDVLFSPTGKQTGNGL